VKKKKKNDLKITKKSKKNTATRNTQDNITNHHPARKTKIKKSITQIRKVVRNHE